MVQVRGPRSLRDTFNVEIKPCAFVLDEFGCAALLVVCAVRQLFLRGRRESFE